MMSANIFQYLLDVAQVLTPMISVGIAIGTLWDNHKMLENQTRPYLTIYSNFLAYKPTFVYLILRNFGQGNAYIADWHSEPDLSPYAIPKNKKGGMPNPFAHIKGTTIAPGQAIQVPLLYQDLKKASQESGHIGILKFSYEYTCNGKKYKEEASVNISLNEDHAVTIIGENEKPDLAISNILHERNVHNL